VPPHVHMQYKSTVTPTQKLHTFGQNQPMLSLNCLILNETKYVLDRQCCSMIGKQIKLRVICLLWKSALVGGCFSLDLGQLIVVDSQKYENLPISSKQHMIISHQQ